MKKRIIPLITLCALFLSLTTPAFAADGGFPDVPASHWANSAIIDMSSCGVVTGYEDGSFQPAGKVKVVEFAAMLSRLIFPNELNKHQNKLRWWTPYMETLYDTGALDNTSFYHLCTDGSWDEDVANLTTNRYDMAQIMYNALMAKHVSLPDSAAIQRAVAEIADYESVPSQYKAAVATMYAAGCLTGVDATGNFQGNDKMQRAQACVVLCRLRDKEPDSMNLVDSIGKISDINIIPEQEEVNMSVGDCIIFSFPNLTDYQMTVKSSNASVVEAVDNSYISAVGSGTADVTITLQTSEGKGTIVCKVTVLDTDTPPHPSGPLTKNMQAVREEMLDLINHERAKVGARPLVLDEELCKVAQLRATELPVLFSHNRPDGRDCYSALDELNVPYRSAGENIAAGQPSVAAVMDGWMNSAGHRANILDKHYTKVGIGVYECDGGYGVYWTQMFAG